MKRVILASLGALCLFASVTNAQILRTSITLLVSQVVTGVTTGSFVALNLNPNSTVKYRPMACRLWAVNNSGTTPTLDGRVEHCPTNSASDCDTLITFTQCTTGSCNSTGKETVHLNKQTATPFPLLRAVLTPGGTSPNYTASVVCYYE